MNEIEPIIIFILSGVLLRASLIYAGQAWAKSYAQTLAFFLLPMVTYIITKVITGNIAFNNDFVVSGDVSFNKTFIV